MKRKRLLILTLTLCMLILASLITYVSANGGNGIRLSFRTNKNIVPSEAYGKIDNRQNPVKKKDIPKNYYEEAVENDFVPEDPNKDLDGLASDKREKILELRKSMNPAFEKNIRKEAIIKGEMDENYKRISLKELKDIISKNANFDDIMYAIESIHGYPDLSGGSGTSYCEYWLDDEGSEYIHINLTYGKIYYGKKSNGVLISEEVLFEDKD